MEKEATLRAVSTPNDIYSMIFDYGLVFLMDQARDRGDHEMAEMYLRAIEFLEPLLTRATERASDQKDETHTH